MYIINLKDHDLIRVASYSSVITAFIIMLVKSYGWLSTDSQSIFASFIDSLLDISSSIINLIAVRFVLLPPDDNHRFGHDKFQDLAIFSQSAFFFLSGLVAIFSSSKALYMKEVPENAEFGVEIMYLCIILTFGLLILQAYVVKKTHSRIIATDKLHYFTDLLTNIAVVASLYLSSVFWYIDAIIGLCIALYIIHASVGLFKGAIKNLSDEEFEQEDREKIIQIIKSVPRVHGFHELKTRSAGNKPFIQFHLEIDGALSLLEAHNISDMISNQIMHIFPNAEIIIHQDPV